MIWNVLQIQFRRLRHNRIELAMMFAVPIAFFSVFALIFGSGIGGATTPKIDVAVIDEVDSAASAAVVESIEGNELLRQMRSESGTSITRSQASDRVRDGSITIAIVVTEKSGRLGIDLLSDASDQVASQVVSSIASRGLAAQHLRRSPGPASPTASRAPPPNRIATLPGTGAFSRVATQPPAAVQQSLAGESWATGNGPGFPTPLVDVVDVIGDGKSNPVISMYAAGIAVMFLLFGATGAGGTLLEERENQTLDRLLSTQMTMDQLLLGKWFSITAVGVIQVSVMFVFAQVVFGVDLTGHLDGFAMMTVVTASAAAAFGLFLATLCQSRGQLNGLSVILVLTMSALGGSMVPRYLMSESLRHAGLWTFNAWALDGYNKIFWRDLPVESLAPQLSVLMISGIGFLYAARLLAVRWESQ